MKTLNLTTKMVVFITLMVFGVIAEAQTGPVIDQLNVMGYLKTQAGTPVADNTSPYTLGFGVFVGGQPVWGTTNNAITTVSGLFAYALSGNGLDLASGANACSLCSGFNNDYHATNLITAIQSAATPGEVMIRVVVISPQIDGGNPYYDIVLGAAPTAVVASVANTAYAVPSNTVTLAMMNSNAYAAAGPTTGSALVATNSGTGKIDSTLLPSTLATSGANTNITGLNPTGALAVGGAGTTGVAIAPTSGNATILIAAAGSGSTVIGGTGTGTTSLGNTGAGSATTITAPTVNIGDVNTTSVSISPAGSNASVGIASNGSGVLTVGGAGSGNSTFGNSTAPSRTSIETGSDIYTYGTGITVPPTSAFAIQQAAGGTNTLTLASNTTGTTAINSGSGGVKINSGAGSVQVTGNTILEGGSNLQMNGSAAGTLTVQVPATVTTYSMTLPDAAPGADGDILSSLMTGVASWVTPQSIFSSGSPLTTLGDVMYGAAGGTATRLAGNTTATKQYLTQTGTGAASAAPVWAAISASDLPSTLTATTVQPAAGGITVAGASGSVTTIGAASGASSVDIQSGSGGIAVDPGFGNVATVGDAGGNAETIIQSGTGGIALTGAVTASSTLSASTSLSAPTVTSSSAMSVAAAAGSTTTVGVGGAVGTAASNITIDPGTGASTLQLGDGQAVNASTTNIYSGSGGITMQPANNTSSSNGQTGYSIAVTAGAESGATGNVNGGGIGIVGGAASATAGTGVGGAITITSGDGSASGTAGNIVIDSGAGGTTGTIQVGPTNALSASFGGVTSQIGVLETTAVDIGTTSAANEATTIASGTGGIAIQPASISTNSGTGSAVAITGGNETGTTSTGGSVTIDAGTGVTTANGNVNVGATNALTTTVGNTTGASAVNIKAGSGGINFSTTGQINFPGSGATVVVPTRFMQAVPNAGAATFTAIGIAAPTLVGTPLNNDQSTGVFVQETTAAAANDCGSVVTGAIGRIGHAPIFESSVMTSATITNQRIVSGLQTSGTTAPATACTAGAAGLDSPITVSAAYFRYSTTASDTKWEIVTCDASACNAQTSTSANIAASTIYTLRIILTTTQAQFFVNGTLVGTSTAHLPAAATNLEAITAIDTTSATAEAMSIGRITVMAN